MKRVIFISTAVFTTTAIFLFRHGRKKKHHPPIMKFNDLYRDNICAEAERRWKIWS